MLGVPGFGETAKVGTPLPRLLRALRAADADNAVGVGGVSGLGAR